MQPNEGNGYHSAGYLSWFAKHGKEAPYHAEHGTVDDIRKNLKRMQTTNWRMVGPGLLECDTEHGVLRQSIPNDYICVGTDDNGMPELAKIKPQ